MLGVHKHSEQISYYFKYFFWSTLFLICLFHFKFIWKADWWRQWQRDLADAWNSSNAHHSWYWQVEAGSWKLNMGLLHRWEEPRCLSHYCCISGYALAGSWNWKCNHDWNLGTLIWGMGVASGVLIDMPNVQPFWHFNYWCIIPFEVFP